MAFSERSYPHVDQIQDQAVKQSFRLIWDRVYSMEKELQDLSKRVDVIGRGQPDPGPVAPLPRSTKFPRL